MSIILSVIEAHVPSVDLIIRSEIHYQTGQVSMAAAENHTKLDVPIVGGDGFRSSWPTIIRLQTDVCVEGFRRMHGVV